MTEIEIKLCSKFMIDIDNGEESVRTRKDVLSAWHRQCSVLLNKFLNEDPSDVIVADAIRAGNSLIMQLEKAKDVNIIGQYYHKDAEYNDEQAYSPTKIKNLVSMDYYIRVCDIIHCTNGYIYNEYLQNILDFFCLIKSTEASKELSISNMADENDHHVVSLAEFISWQNTRCL